MVQLPEPPRARVNPQMYILVGEVIGYTLPVTDPNNFRGTAIGVQMKIVEAIHVPSHKGDYVEVFMFRHGPDCLTEAIEGKPAIGSRYRLALYPARIVSNVSGDGHVRLESTVFSRISLDEPLLGFSTSAGSIFDYKTNIPFLVRSTASPETYGKRSWVDDFLYIESSKDLIRFANASNERERIAVLERLLYSPYVDYRMLLLPKLFQTGRFSYFNLQPPTVTKTDMRRLSTKRKELLLERIKLEESGKLRIWN